MKKILVIVFMLIPEVVLTYEMGTFNLKSPTNLKKGQAELNIQHRFYGRVNEETLNTFLGTDMGANIGVNLRYVAWPGLELEGGRFWNRKEYTAGIGYAYSHTTIPLHGQLNIFLFSYEELNLKTISNERKNGIFSLLSLQGKPIVSRIVPVANLGYDSHNQKFGAGFGTAIIVLKRSGIIQQIDIAGEYFPTTEESENERSFNFGVSLQTYDHHFDFILSNGSEIGARRLMMGEPGAKGLRFGFNIKRRLQM